MSLLQRKGVQGNGAGDLGAQRAVGERSAGAAAGSAPTGAPNPELLERPLRRRFIAEYKLGILREADGLTGLGEIGALLRREGLYSSHLYVWRRQRDEGAFEALSQPRGRKPANPLLAENAELRRCLTRTEAELEKAPPGDRSPGKRLRASGRACPAQGREARREHRVMMEEAVRELAPLVGARPACRALGVSPASIYRRRRPSAHKTPRPRLRPTRALSEIEQKTVLAELHGERFADSSPAQVWATLLDEGRYLCSERTMYRLLAGCGEVRERRDQLTHPAYLKPELLAQRPDEVWSWDITKLKGPATWTYYYLYAILDIFSRYVVGWTVQYRESGEIAKALIAQAATQQKITPGSLTVHADRGSSMTSKPVAFLLADLGVAKTHNRPYTSTDNPYSEAHFKTLKYRPAFPNRFNSIEEARTFCRDFFSWYNHEHRHSGIGLMTPGDRPLRPHEGDPGSACLRPR